MRSTSCIRGPRGSFGRVDAFPVPERVAAIDATPNAFPCSAAPRSVYAALKRLERSELTTSWWEGPTTVPPQRRRRRYIRSIVQGFLRSGATTMSTHRGRRAAQRSASRDGAVSPSVYQNSYN